MLQHDQTTQQPLSLGRTAASLFSTTRSARSRSKTSTTLGLTPRRPRTSRRTRPRPSRTTRWRARCRRRGNTLSTSAPSPSLASPLHANSRCVPASAQSSLHALRLHSARVHTFASCIALGCLWHSSGHMPTSTCTHSLSHRAFLSWAPDHAFFQLAHRLACVPAPSNRRPRSAQV